MKKNFVSRGWFIVGILSATSIGAFANLPKSGDLSGSMAPTQDVSEIRAKRNADLSFDQDLKHLSAVQGRYRENLPTRKKKVSSAKKFLAPRPRAKVSQR